MAEAFPISGNIEPASFPNLLVDLHRRGATGSLKVTGPVHPKALYFRGGRILFGSSNDPRDQLGAILIESGRITREQLDEVNLKVGPGNPLAKVLAESGFVNQRELGDAARVKVERILADALSWETGSFEFEDGILPKNAPDLRLSTERLLLAATQSVPDRTFALRHVDLGTVFEPAPEGEPALSEVRAEVWPLLERLDGHRTLKDAIALTRLDEFEAAKTACAMLFLGIVRRVALGDQELDLAEEAQSGLGAEAPMYTVPLEAMSLPGPEPEPTGFAFSEPEPAPFPVIEPEADHAADTVLFPLAQAEPLVEAAPETDLFSEPLPALVPEAPTAIPAVPSFTMDAPRRRPTDTVPGDRPAYVPPPPEPELSPTVVYEPPAPEIDADAPSPASRPTQEDLAALDALLSPSAPGPLPPAPVAPPEPEKWQPQFRPPTTPPRRAPLRPTASSSAPSSARTSAPWRVRLLIAVALAFAAVGTFLAWYFRAPSPIATPAPAPTAVAHATPLPTAAPTAEPSVAPTPEATVAPTPTPTATAAPVATPTPILRPTPSPLPTTTAAPAGPVAPAGGGRALLVQGALPEASRAFAAALAPGARGRFSVQVLVACAPENVTKAVIAVPSEELYVLPVSLKGRACYRLCWGAFDSRPAAEAALSSLPMYFRQGGSAPRVAPLAELLP